MASKVIIVTGASRGIGLAVAKYLIDASHKVLLVSRTDSQMAALKKQYPSQVEYMTADLSNLETAPKVTELAVKAFGRLDGLVINHGVLSPMTTIADANLADWQQIYAANLFSAVALSKAAIPLLRQTKGRIIFTSSGAALHAYQSWGAYGSSKAAMNSLAQHLGAEEKDIVTVAIGPGRCDTDMQVEVRDAGKSAMATDAHQDFVKAFEAGKLNKPEWPGHVIAQLALTASPDLSGKYFSWNAPEMAAYRSDSK
ncbi:uncharacterized protein E0L32_005444 [Thyridium curvatum]|uniref:Ketoreductase domain-containing protein n=1 Tax=Thyridium curvatum TaxID=1093900 RepID=A0A507BD30_9PEZI|nr:uncharacterized protein E0L32_005444 [Thyridium curvatum]TPX14480.1 hypothetical protein E0L32_005444 [Thyridium curvatum]